MLKGKVESKMKIESPKVQTWQVRMTLGVHRKVPINLQAPHMISQRIWVRISSFNDRQNQQKLNAGCVL